ncbi:MAG: transglutaminaseTgpA domain-containing protein [Planctomycetaceae bacterium]
MSSTTVFKLSVYVFLAYCSFMLWYALGTFFPQGLALILVPLALGFEYRPIIVLPTWAANTLGLFACVIVGLEITGAIPLIGQTGGLGLEDAQIRSWYKSDCFPQLDCAVYGEKNELLLGHAGPGVLQVAFTCMFKNSSEYSILLVLFLIQGIWALIAFMIYEAQLQHNRLGIIGVNAQIPMNFTDRKIRPDSHFRKPSSVEGSIKLEPGSNWFSRSLLIGFVMICLVILLVSLVLYVFIPRVWGGNFRRDLFNQNQRMESGFNDKVELGKSGSIVDNDEVIMEFSLQDEAGNHVDLDGYVASLGYEAPYFRGNVLSNYERNVWQETSTLFAKANYSERGFYMHMIKEMKGKVTYVQENIRLKGTPTGHLFSIYPALDFSTDPTIDRVPVFNRETNLWSLNGGLSSELNYSVKLFDPEFVQKATKDDLSRPFVWPMKRQNREYQKILRENLQLPENIEAVHELAQELARKSLIRQNLEVPEGKINLDGPPEVVLGVVDDLNAYLRDEKNFTYTTEPQVSDSTIDPVVDFLINTKTGHCEYYASALALMCRSLGIPARLVTGYRGAKKNTVNNLYYIEQSRAHAWVEVHVRETGMVKWFVYDPTPYILDLEYNRDKQRGYTIADFLTAISSSWRNMIVNFSTEQQANVIFRPIAQKAGELYQLLKERGFSEFLKELWATIKNPANWFSWTGLIFILIAGAILFAIRNILRRIWRRLSRLWGKWGWRRGQIYSDCLFQRTLQTDLQKSGLVKLRYQTELEFATQVQESWREYLIPHGLQNFPLQLAVWFYQIRYGHKQPRSGEMGSLNERLDQFEQEVQKIPRFEPQAELQLER